MTVPSHFKTFKERQISRWWFNIVVEEQAISSAPSQIVKTREKHILVRSLPLETFVCLDSDELRTFNLAFFGVVNPTVWIIILTVAFLLCFIHKSLKAGVDFMLAIAAIPVNSQNRKRVGYFLFWAMFVAHAWNSQLSANVLSIQQIPDFSILIKNNWRTWISKQYVSNGVSLFIRTFGANIWHGKTTEDILYVEPLDPIPCNDSLALVEKLKINKLTIFAFLERSFESRVWKKAHFIGRRTVCKTILFNSNIRREQKYGGRIWGSEYAQVFSKEGLNQDLIFIGEISTIVAVVYLMESH